jgi:hypothetical protein
MKKRDILIALAAMIAAGVLIFYPDRDDKKEKSILPEKSGDEQTALVTPVTAAHANSGTDMDTEIIKNEKETVEEVKKNNVVVTTEEPAANTVVFYLENERKTYTYTSYQKLLKLTLAPEKTGYVANFIEDQKKLDLKDESTYSHVLSFFLPVDITPTAFDERSDEFMFQFFGTEPGSIYMVNPGYDFSFTITECGGSSGRARGIFSGTLKAANSANTISIRDGKFDIEID